MDDHASNGLRDDRPERSRQFARLGPDSAAEPKTSADHFSGPRVPLQVKLPDDLVQSLRLHSISSGRTISDIVLEALTTDAVVRRAWVATKRAA